MYFKWDHRNDFEKPRFRCETKLNNWHSTVLWSGLSPFGSVVNNCLLGGSLTLGFTLWSTSNIVSYNFSIIWDFFFVISTQVRLDFFLFLIFPFAFATEKTLIWEIAAEKNKTFFSVQTYFPWYVYKIWLAFEKKNVFKAGIRALRRQWYINIS